MEINELIKEMLFGVAPLGAGVYLFDQDIFVAIALMFFGCIIISLLVWNYLEREKAMRRTYGFGYLK